MDTREEKLGKAACEWLGEEYAEKAYEQLMKSLPEHKKSREVKQLIDGCVREMYYKQSGIYEEPDRILLSERAYGVLENDPVGRNTENYETVSEADFDIRVELEKEERLVSEVETFGDLLNKETEPLPESELIVIEKTLS